MSSEDSETDEEKEDSTQMEDDEEVIITMVTPLLFPQPALSATSHLAHVGAHIASFGKFR